MLPHYLMRQLCPRITMLTKCVSETNCRARLKRPSDDNQLIYGDVMSVDVILW